MFSKERYNSPPAPNFFYGRSGFPVSAFSILSNCTLGTLSIFWNLTLCVFLSVWYFEGIGAAESLQIQSSALRLETSRFFSGQNILDQPDQCETFQKLLLPKFSGVWVTRSGSYSVRLWSVLLNNLNPPHPPPAPLTPVDFSSCYPFSKYALISQNRLLPLIENCCNIWNKTRGPQPIFGEIGNQTYAAGPNGFPYRNQTCFFPYSYETHSRSTENIFANVRLSAVTFMIACYRRTGLTYHERLCWFFQCRP